MASKPNQSSTRTVFWWVIWIFLTIATFFVAVAFWSPVIARHFGSVRETKAAVMWLAAVFGTWIVMLVPLIIVMYQKVDKAYEDARMNREKKARQFRSLDVDISKRRLSASLVSKLKAWPETLESGHLVSVVLKDGRRYPHVFIRNQNEILGIYDQKDLPFEAQDIDAIEAEDPKEIAYSFTPNWLRLDGVTTPE